MTIGSLARAADVGVETVRYYQRRGLIDQPERGGGPAGGVRRYGEIDLKRLRFIRSAQAAGFTLEEIAVLLELDRRDDRARAREMAAARIAALEKRIEELTSARDALRRLASECGSGSNGPCPILAAFDSHMPVPGCGA